MKNEIDIDVEDIAETSVTCGCCLVLCLLMLVASVGLTAILIGLGKFIYNLIF